MSETRAAIRHHVERHPGVHFRALVRELDLAPGQVQYHLRRLRRGGRLVREEYGGRTHFFTPNHDEATRRQLAVLRRETAREALEAIASRSTRRPATVAEELGIARSTLEWHLSSLVEEGLLEKRHRADGTVELAPTDPDLVARRLAAVEPTVPDRLVDRFTRLADDLLYGD